MEAYPCSECEWASKHKDLPCIPCIDKILRSSLGLICLKCNGNITLEEGIKWVCFNCDDRGIKIKNCYHCEEILDKDDIVWCKDCLKTQCLICSTNIERGDVGGICVECTRITIRSPELLTS
jgi:hypothetical protein